MLNRCFVVNLEQCLGFTVLTKMFIDITAYRSYTLVEKAWTSLVINQQYNERLIIYGNRTSIWQVVVIRKYKFKLHFILNDYN